MISIRELTQEDIPALQSAIDRDKFHPDEWRVDHFLPGSGAPVVTEIIEDGGGPIAFVRYTKTLRISCVWNDADKGTKNARAIIHGIRAAVLKARESGFSEITITTSHPKLAVFLTRIIGMTKSSDEYILAV